MRPGIRRLWLVLACAAALLVLAAAMIPLLVDVDRFRPRIEATLAQQLGRPVRLQPLRLSLWTGITVRTAGIEVGTRDRGLLSAGPVRLRPALVPLLQGTLDLRGIAAESVEIVRPRGSLLQGGRLKARFSQTRAGDLDVAGTLHGTWAALPGAPVGTVTLEGTKRSGVLALARFVVEVGPTRLDLAGRAEGVGTGSSRWELRGSGQAPGSQGKGNATLVLTPDSPRLDFALEFARLDFGELAALAGLAGGVAAARPPSEGTQTPFLEQLTTELQLDRGSVRLRDASFELYGGRHRGTLALDARADGLPFTLVSRVEGVDVARLLAAWSPGSAGVVRGTGAFDLDLRGVAHAPEVLSTLGGTLRLQVRDGALTTVGLLETVAALLEAAGGRGIGREETPFRALAGTFAVHSGVAHTEDLALVADDLRLDVRGDLDLQGPLALQGVVAFSPEVSASMVGQVSALRVRQGQDGRLTVPLVVQGTLSSPRVQVDVKRIVREGMREESREALQRKVEQTTKKLLDRLRR